MSKNLTVVVPVKNESGSLKIFLDPIPEFVSEIIVVDGNSTDNSFEIANSHARVSRVVKQQSRGVNYFNDYNWPRPGFHSCATWAYMVANRFDCARYVRENRCDCRSCRNPTKIVVSR